MILTVTEGRKGWDVVDFFPSFDSALLASEYFTATGCPEVEEKCASDPLAESYGCRDRKEKPYSD